MTNIHTWQVWESEGGQRTSGRLVAAMQMTGPASDAPLSKAVQLGEQLVQRLLALIIAHAAQPRVAPCAPDPAALKSKASQMVPSASCAG